jgi:hypothetical protein
MLVSAHASTVTEFFQTPQASVLSKRTESLSSITNAFHNVVEKQNPYNLKIDADALNRGRRRFCIRRKVYHIYQVQWMQYAGNFACVYGLCSVKNKIEIETNLSDCTSNLT